MKNSKCNVSDWMKRLFLIPFWGIPLMVRAGAPADSAFVNAMFPGGDSCLRDFISANFRVPSEAQMSSISSRMEVSFVVEKDGYITDVKLQSSSARQEPLPKDECERYVYLKGLDALEKEAIRVGASLPCFIPAFQGGIPVAVPFSITL